MHGVPEQYSTMHMQLDIIAPHDTGGFRQPSDHDPCDSESIIIYKSLQCLDDDEETGASETSVQGVAVRFMYHLHWHSDVQNLHTRE